MARHQCRRALVLGRLPRKVARSKLARQFRAVIRQVENDDPPAGVERRADTAHQPAFDRVGIVGHQHDVEMTVLAPGSSTRRSAGAGALGPSTCSAVSSRVRAWRRGEPSADRVAVDPAMRRGTVPVDFCHVDRRSTPSVNASSVPVRSRRSTPRSSETVAGAGRDAPNGSPCAAAAAATTRSDPSPPRFPAVRAAGRGRIGQLRQTVALAKKDYLDALLTRPLGKAGAPGRAITCTWG